MSKVLTLHLPDTLPTVERVLVEEVMDGLIEFVHEGGAVDLARARLALGVLYGWVDGNERIPMDRNEQIPATHDECGEVMGHGRCVV